MTAAHVIPEGRASSLGARLYDAMQAVAIESGLPSLGARRLETHDSLTQSLYERAAASFVASLTYAESDGVREAMLSSLLLEALKGLTRDVQDYPAWARPCLALDNALAAIATAEAAAPRL